MIGIPRSAVTPTWLKGLPVDETPEPGFTKIRTLRVTADASPHCGRRYGRLRRAERRCCPGRRGPGRGRSADLLAPKLVDQASGASANRHLIALQRIADTNGGTRAANTPGYDASVEYIAGKLSEAGFDVETPEFAYQEQVVDAETFTVGDTAHEVLTMEFSPQTPEGGITGPLAVVPEDEDATTGCEATDFATQSYDGTIALIRRGECPFAQKAQNAADAGAIGAVISNNVDGDVPVNGTLGDEASASIPTAGLSQDDGTALADDSGESATLKLRYHAENARAET